jgi:site-specific recombinase XerD
VFLTDEGFPLTLSGLGSIFERLKKRSGISRLHAHLLRHTALTMMIEREVPAFVVQGWAGHTSVQTTQIYVHLAQRRTNLKYQKNSVVDGLQILKHRPSRRPSARRKQGPLSSS